ncbi:MAG: 2-dehydro-3-deoxygalactonokinase, partial [Casimicrobium sp.]
TIGKALVSTASRDDNDAIKRGIARARASANWLHDLFTYRSRLVTGAANEASLSSEFSGWLIASEFMQAKDAFSSAGNEIYVIASDTLMPWYEHISNAFDLRCRSLDGETCVARGLWRIAQRLPFSI